MSLGREGDDRERGGDVLLFSACPTARLGEALLLLDVPVSNAKHMNND